MTLDLILSVMDSLLKLALLEAQSITPEQRADFWARHESRLRRLDGMLERFIPSAGQNAGLKALRETPQGDALTPGPG